MTDYHFPLDEYLSRIGVTDVGCVSIEQLESLHRAQVHTVPFENLDVQLGRGIVLDPAHVDEKIIRRRRGGYCFELNALFNRALNTLGYETRAVLARVHVTGEPGGRGHQLTQVTLDNRQWIVHERVRKRHMSERCS